MMNKALYVWRRPLEDTMNQSFDKLFCPRIAKCNSHCTIYIQGVKGESGKSLSSKSEELFVSVKFSFSEKGTKIRKNLPLVLMLLSENSCFAKTSGRFFPILWPSHNVLTLQALVTSKFWTQRFSRFSFHTLYYIHLISSIVDMWICRNSLDKDVFWRKESTAVNSLM